MTEPWYVQLFVDGYTTIPLFNCDEVNRIRDEIYTDLEKAPELINVDRNKTKFATGFGALGIPSSFHCLSVRNLRNKAANELLTKLQEMGTSLREGRKLEIEFDRLCIRAEGSNPGKETWHRDQSPHTLNDDEVFGGWINLGPIVQTFSFVPGTHLDIKGKSGFDVIDKEVALDYSKKRKKISIQPGHWLIFYQNIIHELVGKKQPKQNMKLFFGFRLTNGTEPIFDHTKIIEEQGVPFIPSGQNAVMYSPNSISFWKQQTIDWSLNSFHPNCLETKKGGDGKEYQIVNRVMKSLESYGFQKYLPYTKEERQLFVPMLINPNRLNKRSLEQDQTENKKIMKIDY